LDPETALFLEAGAKAVAVCVVKIVGPDGPGGVRAEYTSRKESADLSARKKLIERETVVEGLIVF
jgi:hypothetical protein